MLTSIEICSGGGGQALGLEQAGFDHLALVENDKFACSTLKLNRSNWNVLEMDIKDFSAIPYRGIDLVAGGVPCPPFSKAGKQLGKDDERDLFPEAIRIVEESRPKALMLENVRGLLDKRFDNYRSNIDNCLGLMGYKTFWKLLNSSDYSVPQLRPRVILIALKEEVSKFFEFPKPNTVNPMTVGEALEDLMASDGWDTSAWMLNANKIAPTIVGGSKKHGGPDLGPTRAKRAWSELGVDGHGIADLPPKSDFIGHPKLTTRMAARLQGFPDEWNFYGRKTNAYRQVGNAFPPPAAKAVALQIKKAIMHSDFGEYQIAA